MIPALAAKRYPLQIICLVFFTLAVWVPRRAQAKVNFKTADIEGWQVDFDQELLDDRSGLMSRIQNKLQTRLSEIKAILPARRIEELQRIPIYVQSHNSYAVFYYGNGGGTDDPTLSGRVIIGNAASFLSDIEDVPSRVLHELSHGYHNQILGLDDPDIQRAYDHAMSSHLYENVRDYKGRVHDKSYALTTKGEYFALLTQAYYLRSGYFPFTREQLETYDPEGFKVVRAVWEDRAGPQPEVRLQAATLDGSCSSAQILKSEEGLVPVQLTLRNGTDTPLVLWWVSYKGERKMRTEIPANSFYKRKTFATNVWEIDNGGSGHCIGIIQPKTLGEHVEVF